MAMIIWNRGQHVQTFARRFTMPSNLSRISPASAIANRNASSSSNPSADDIKFPFKVAPMEVKPPEQYRVLPDPIEHATGIEKKELLARLQGDDRYEAKVYHIGNKGASKDDPVILPSHYEARLIGCSCEPDQHFVRNMWLRKDTGPKRCFCGYWLKLVDAEPDLF